MNEEIDFETLFKYFKNKFGIYLFDTKNLKNLYKKKLTFKNDKILLI